MLQHNRCFHRNEVSKVRQEKLFSLNFFLSYNFNSPPQIEWENMERKKGYGQRKRKQKDFQLKCQLS